jgi:very-short-patch-repair endonuclease
MRLERDELEAAINEADKRDLIDPEALSAAVAAAPRRPGLGVLRETLDRRTFTRTDTWLERRFLPIARRVGLPPPLTQQWVNGFRVDFYWPDLGLVVETDGLRYHRTPAEQAQDRIRDQAHTAAGLTPLRFTRAQVRFDPEQVEAILGTVVRRLRGGPWLSGRSRAPVNTHRPRGRPAMAVARARISGSVGASLTPSSPSSSRRSRARSRLPTIAQH